MITQSGNLAVNAIGSRRGIDFHTLVSAGNQTILDAGDWLAALARREGIRSIALFLEEDGDGARLAESLALCAERRVGVAVLKVGESRAGAEAAAAHTGAVAGDQRAFRALVEEAGATWVRDPHGLLEAARVLAEPRARPSRGEPSGLAVLTCSGGDSGIAADLAEEEGIELPPLADETTRRLAELLPSAATPGNPLDYTSLIWGETELWPRSSRRSAGTPASTSCCCSTTTPPACARSTRRSGARFEPDSPTARSVATRLRLIALDVAGPAGRGRRARALRPRDPGGGGPRHGAGVCPRTGGRSGRSQPAFGRSRPRPPGPARGRRSPRRVAGRGGVEATASRPRPSRSRGRRARGGGRGRVRRQRERTRLASGA